VVANPFVGNGGVSPRPVNLRMGAYMETLENDGAAVRFPPPLIYLIAVIAGGLLHYFVFPFPLALPLTVRVGLAVLAALIGLAIIRGAFGLFRRTGQDPKPWMSTPEVIATGIYRFTRNPMYLGMALIQLSIGIGLGNGWIVALLPPALVMIHLTAIRHEEAYLERKFGETYTRYKASVRRWL
jgi:protein-S-isoprenylcysteine O-methyltransferase Ste14